MKILDRGYWISQHFYWQSMGHYLWNSAKFGSFTFFSACNRAISMGGMLDDSKTEAYRLLPRDLVPQTTVVRNMDGALLFMEQNNLTFPIIVKPNVGLKGFMVLKIENETQLSDFFQSVDTKEREWLLQEYLNAKREYSVLYYRLPGRKESGITSFIEKEYPHVIGDGDSTLNALISKYKNPFLEVEEVRKKLHGKLHTIPEKGEHVVLDYIGNYSRGAKFYSRMSEVDLEMEEMLKSKLHNVNGLNFFRIDLKAESVASFKRGEFKVLEVNGLKSEPLHIYDSSSSFFNNSAIIKNHWEVIAKVAKAQYAIDSDVPTLKEGLRALASIKKLVK